MNDFNLNSVGLNHRLPSPQIIHPAPAPSVWSFQMEPGPQYTSSMHASALNRISDGLIL